MSESKDLILSTLLSLDWEIVKSTTSSVSKIKLTLVLDVTWIPAGNVPALA